MKIRRGENPLTGSDLTADMLFMGLVIALNRFTRLEFYKVWSEALAAVGKTWSKGTLQAQFLINKDVLVAGRILEALPDDSFRVRDISEPDVE